MRSLLQIPTAANTQLSKGKQTKFCRVKFNNEGAIEFGSYVDDVSDGFQRVLDHVPLAQVDLTM